MRFPWPSVNIRLYWPFVGIILFFFPKLFKSAFFLSVHFRVNIFERKVIVTTLFSTWSYGKTENLGLVFNSPFVHWCLKDKKKKRERESI